MTCKYDCRVPLAYKNIFKENSAKSKCPFAGIKIFTYKVNGTISYIFCTVGANKK